MKLRKKIIKGFTLVELVVVIAVIAILAAVSVGAYFGVTTSANISADQQLITQLNKMILNDTILNGKKENIEELQQLFKLNGIEDTTPSYEKHQFLWDTEDDVVLIWNTSDLKVTFPETQVTKHKDVSSILSTWKDINEVQPEINPNAIQIKFSNVENKVNDTSIFDIGENFITSSNDESIKLSYEGLISKDQNWQSLRSEGYFRNTTPITGLESIAISSSSELAISYSFDGVSYYKENRVLNPNEVYNFNGHYPSYFKVSNISNNGVDITSILLTYNGETSVAPSIEYKNISNDGNYAYELGDRGVTITKYLGEYSEIINIPSSIDGYPVIKIARFAFTKSEPSLSLNIKNKSNNNSNKNNNYHVPDDIEEIEEGSFEEGSNIFSDSDSIKENWKDANVKDVGLFKVGQEDIVYDEENKMLFFYSRVLNAFYLFKSYTTSEVVNLPEEIKLNNEGLKPVRYVYNEAFLGNSYIKELNVNGSYMDIRDRAFYDCINLEKVNFTDSSYFQEIGDLAFFNCPISTFKLPNTINTLWGDSLTFGLNSSITEIIIPINIAKLGGVPVTLSNSNIKKIIFEGDEASFSYVGSSIINEINRYNSTCENESDKVILEYKNFENSIRINASTVKEVIDTPIGSIISGTFIYLGYRRTHTLMDFVSNEVFEVYDKRINYSNPGDVIEITGTKVYYSGGYQINKLTVANNLTNQGLRENCANTIFENTPTVTFDEVYNNLEQYENKNLVFESLTLNKRDGGYSYFGNSNSKNKNLVSYYFSQKKNTNTYVGNTYMNFMGHYYDYIGTYQLALFDNLNGCSINYAEPQETTIKSLLKNTEFYTPYIVEGTITSINYTNYGSDGIAVLTENNSEQRSILLNFKNTEFVLNGKYSVNLYSTGEDGGVYEIISTSLIDNNSSSDGENIKLHYMNAVKNFNAFNGRYVEIETLVQEDPESLSSNNFANKHYCAKYNSIDTTFTKNKGEMNFYVPCTFDGTNPMSRDSLLLKGKGIVILDQDGVPSIFLIEYLFE